LEHRGKDPAWREKFFVGDVATVEEVHRLNKLVADTPDVERALAGAGMTPFEYEAPASGASASLNDQISFVADSRAVGVRDESLRAILSHRVGTKDDVQWAQEKLTRIHRALQGVPRAQWPREWDEAAREYAAIASPTELK
jgi:hypothetical protein